MLQDLGLCLLARTRDEEANGLYRGYQLGVVTTNNSVLPGGIVTRHLEENPHHLLRLAAILGAESRSADVEEGRLALSRHGLGQHRFSRTRRSEHQNTYYRVIHFSLLQTSYFEDTPL